MLRRILSFVPCFPLVACVLIVWLTLVLFMIAKSPGAMRHFHTDKIFTRGDLVSSVSVFLASGCYDFLEFSLYC